MRRLERESRLREEIALHVELETEANIRRGMTPDVARRAALIAFGAAEHYKDEARDQFRSPIVAAAGQDLRYAWRAVRGTPMLSAVAVATLAAAFTLVTAAFTAVNGVLFRSLPFPDPQRLVLIWGTVAGTANRDPVSFTNAEDWRRGTRSLESLAMFSCTPRPILAARGEPARASMMEVSVDFFRVLRARPMLGRLFDSTDFVSGAGASIVLTYPLWRDRFGADSAVLRSRAQLDGVSARIIGVLPPDYSPLPTSLACRPQLYRPLASRYDDEQRSWSFLKVVARLEPDGGIAQAQADLDVENARLARAYPVANAGHGAVMVSMSAFLARPLRPMLWFAQVGALLVLLIACANIASLLLARGTVRQREFAIRIAMGASRGRLARQIATECLLLGGVAAALGTLLTLAATGVLTRLAGDALPDPRGLSVDLRVVAFAFVACLLATAVFGFVAAASARGDGAWLHASLRDGGRGRVGSRSRLGRAVVAMQVALALVVLVGAGLLARSYERAREVRPGFDPAGVLTARVTLPDASYPRGERQIRFFQQVLGWLSRQRGVVAAGGVSILPESPNFDHTVAKVVGRAYAPADVPTPDVYRITPGYFDALQIPLIAGRVFTDADDDRHPAVAVINQTMARELFGAEPALGKRIWTGAGSSERTIVGVVGDVYQYGVERAKTMQLYVPHADNSGGDLTLVVRSPDGAANLIPLVREAVRAVDASVPLDDVLTMDQVLSESASRRRLLAGLSLTFALGAIGLASIGLYGVVAYSVAQRTQEIGVRMAVGASANAILLLVIGDTSALVQAGLATGLLTAALLSRWMAPLVFGVSVTDALTFVVAPVALLVIAAVASAVPAIRATRVNPVRALRAE